MLLTYVLYNTSVEYMPDKPAEPMITLDRVTKTYHTVTALDNISLSIAQGEFLALIGPSGCGKSTLLRLIADLIQPTAGVITVKGKTPTQSRQDRDYGIIFQSPVLYDWRTARRNVALPLEIAGWAYDARTQRAQTMLQLVGLAEFAELYPRQLSGGMQQRIAIARALALSPALLLMDEPFGALDEMTREYLQQELLRIWQHTGATVIFVTHSISEAVFLSDRVVVMSPRPGRIAATVPIDLPRPRDIETREAPGFFALVTEVRERLRERSASKAG